MMSPIFRSLVVLAIATATAHAGPKQKKEAKKHLETAQKAFKDGFYDQALAELQAAYKLDPENEDLFAIGQAYSKLGECDQATTYFKKFRVKAPKKLHAVVDEAIKACTQSAPKPEPEPKSDAFKSGRSDEKPVESTPLATESKVQEPKPEKEEPPPTPTPTPTPTPSPAPAPSPEPTATTSTSISASSEPHWYSDKLGDALVATGIVSGLVGILEYHAATSALDNAENRAQTQTLAQYRSAIDDAHSKRTYAIVLGAGSVVLVGAGVVHYMLHGSAETHGVAIAPSRGGGLVTWSGGF